MKIVVTGDTHGRQGWRVPPCDVFIHCGDMTNGGTLAETAMLAEYLNGREDIANVIITPGNHDRCFHEEPDAVRALFNDRTHILINKGVQIDGKNFWASPYTPPFFDWWYMAEEDELRVMYSRMPLEIDILITHGPPYGILDPGYVDGKRFKDPNAGSKALLGAVTDPSRKILHHVFGHLHAAGGQEQTLASRNGFETTFHNVAACNEAYRIATEPKVIEI